MSRRCVQTDILEDLPLLRVSVDDVEQGRAGRAPEARPELATNRYRSNPISWAFRGILLNQWQDYINGAPAPPYLHYRSVLQSLGLVGSSRWTSVWVLLGIYGGVRIVTYLFVRFIKYPTAG